MQRLALVTALALLGGAAHAADNGIYLGAGVSQAKIDGVGEDFGVDDLNDFELDDTAWKLIAGIRPLDFIAVEVNYMDLGSERAALSAAGNVDVEAKALAGYVVGFLPLPLPLLDVYAKAGLAYWETEGSFSGPLSLNFDDDGTEFAYGFGAQLRFGSLAARLEYEKFDIDNTDGLELLTLGVTWTFL
ncbi:MAG: outer membrane beta-barrel protein [Pseudomonadota bacterium]|nr:MAG: hypothetical protein DIU56_02300 [Pseudomonadota bacterium]